MTARRAYHPTTYHPELATIAFQLAALLEAHLLSPDDALDDEKWTYYARLWVQYAHVNPDVARVGLMA